MNFAIITGSTGLIGSEAVSYFSPLFDKIIGIDNNFRAYFFGVNGSTDWRKKHLSVNYENYVHCDSDIRNFLETEKIFKKYSSDIKLIIHAAAQPSHDWAAKEPITDFTINANGTLNMLELARLYCPSSVFIFTSTNKVYGDTPNSLPLVEHETRWEIEESHRFYKHGIDESMTIDNSTHSLFGASKVAADILAQEYGRYFNMNVGVFRGGCLTGPNQSGTMMHGFLSYLMKCAITGDQYNINGYNGKQVRDNLHSWDLVNMFWHFYQNPRKGETYNVGGGRFSNCSLVEAIMLSEKITGKKMNYSYSETHRKGDHIWYISDLTKFRSHYPGWTWKYSLEDILSQIYNRISKIV